MFEGGSGSKTKPPRFATVGKLQRHGEVLLNIHYLSAGESVGVKSHSCNGTTLVFLIHL